MRRLALLGLLWAVLASPALALTPAKRAVALAPSPRAGICGVANAGTLPYLCIDFQNGIYVRNGVRFPSFLAMGGTLPSGCAITPGATSGASCSGTANLSIPALNPSATGYMVVARASPGTSGTSVIYVLTDGTKTLDAHQGTTSLGVYTTGNTVCASAVTNLATSAFFANSTTTVIAAISGGTPQTCTGGGSPAANGTLRVAGNAGVPVIAPNYVASIRIYPGTYTAAQVQTASGQ